MTRSRRAPAPAPALLAFALVLASGAWAQVSYKPHAHILPAQRILPSSGPGSAWSNPAAIAETRLVSAHGGWFRMRKGGELDFAYQVSLTPPIPDAPIGLSGGFAGLARDPQIDGSNSLLFESSMTPSLALSFPRQPGARYWGAVGAAWPMQTHNAFNAVESRSTSFDLGALASTDLYGSRLRLGWSYLNLERPAIKMPDDRGLYRLPRRMEWSVEWLSRSEAWRVQMGWYRGKELQETGRYRKESRLDAWEVEYRPIPMVGLKAERTRLGGMSCLGVVFRAAPASLPDLRLRAEGNLGHDDYEPPEALAWILGEGVEGERGFTLGLAFGVDY